MNLRKACRLIALTASVGGCTSSAPIYVGPAEQAIHVEQESRVLLLQGVGATERYRLRDFIASASRGRRDALHLDVTGSPRLIARVAREARAMGVASYNIRLFGPHIDQPAGLAVRVEAIIYEAHSPVCPSLSIIGPAINDNSFDQTLGCSTRNNLGAMINDPHDLLGNRSVMATNGDRAAVPLATYGGFAPHDKGHLEGSTNNRGSPDAPSGGMRDVQPSR
ncbi:CpaD family pilus assembly lipoprotein [Bradyrhizobium erythrophlei]|uniref:CpaD family pilus assembly lipoprotein n=1 Tax=Bradyrhizobium erythrophlei TaxID=1437360 RepID=UPI0035E965EC